MARRPPVAPILVALALAGLPGCREETKVPSSAPAPPPPASSAPAPPAGTPAVPGWPTGDSLRAALPPDPGAESLTKLLFRNGDVVLEQRWPDGTSERWWYTQEGRSHYIGRDGREVVGAEETGP